jgi:hypothetical protein
MAPEKLGSLIGGAFGLVFVLVNAGPLPTALDAAVRIIGVVAFVVVLVALRRPRSAVARARPATGGFGRGYWFVVLAEVVAILAGVRLLSGPLDTPDAGVAWAATVVGLHFVALAVVWAQRFFHVLGAAIAVCGLAGLVLALAGAPTAASATVGGVLPGLLLLAFALWGVLTSTDSVRPAPAGRDDAVGVAE